jgi:hypothetical protein
MTPNIAAALDDLDTRLKKLAQRVETQSRQLVDLERKVEQLKTIVESHNRKP